MSALLVGYADVPPIYKTRPPKVVSGGVPRRRWRAVWLSDDDLPDGVRRLIEWINSRAEKSHRTGT